MRAAGPALCALLLLACAQGDNVTESTLVDDKSEALLAGEEAAAAWTWPSLLAVAVVSCCPFACLTCYLFVAGGILFSPSSFQDGPRFDLTCRYMLPSEMPKFEEVELEAKVEEASEALELEAMGQTGEEAEMCVVDRAYLDRVVAGEIVFTTLLPFLCALPWLVIALAFRGKPPAWLQIGLVLPPVLRACAVEQRLARKSVRTLVREDIADCLDHLWKLKHSLIAKLRTVATVVSEDSSEDSSEESVVLDDSSALIAKLLSSFPFLVAKLELVDAVTDGLAISTVFVLERADQVFGARLEAAWHAGPIGRFFAPVVLRVGLSGLMLIVQIVAAFCQVSVGWTGAEMSELAGLGTIASLTDAGKSAEELASSSRARKMAKGCFVKFLEGASQLLLQSSAILAQGTGLLGEPSLAVSVALTSGLLLKEGVQMISVFLSRMARRLGRGDLDCTMVWAVLIVLVPGALMCCAVAAVVLRLGMSETCGDSLLYDVGSFQCVPAPLPTRS